MKRTISRSVFTHIYIEPNGLRSSIFTYENTPFQCLSIHKFWRRVFLYGIFHETPYIERYVQCVRDWSSLIIVE
jgi:hypothetical protein